MAPDGRTLATGGLDQVVKLWDVGSGQEAEGLRGHSSRITSLAYAPDGKTLASGSQDGTVRIWNPFEPHDRRLLSGASPVA